MVFNNNKVVFANRFLGDTEKSCELTVVISLFIPAPVPVVSFSIKLEREIAKLKLWVVVKYKYSKDYSYSNHYVIKEYGMNEYYYYVDIVREVKRRIERDYTNKSKFARSLGISNVRLSQVLNCKRIAKGQEIINLMKAVYLI